MTGDLIAMEKTVEIGLMYHALPLEELDGATDVFADKLARMPQLAIQAATMAVNVSLKQLVVSVMDASLSYALIFREREPNRKAAEAFVRSRSSGHS